jgi:hypothetical protein
MGILEEIERVESIVNEIRDLCSVSISDDINEVDGESILTTLDLKNKLDPYFLRLEEVLNSILFILSKYSNIDKLGAIEFINIVVNRYCTINEQLNDEVKDLLKELSYKRWQFKHRYTIRQDVMASLSSSLAEVEELGKSEAVIIEHISKTSNEKVKKTESKGRSFQNIAKEFPKVFHYLLEDKKEKFSRLDSEEKIIYYQELRSDFNTSISKKYFYRSKTRNSEYEQIYRDFLDELKFNLDNSNEDIKSIDESLSKYLEPLWMHKIGKRPILEKDDIELLISNISKRIDNPKIKIELKLERKNKSLIFFFYQLFDKGKGISLGVYDVNSLSEFLLANFDFKTVQKKNDFTSNLSDPPSKKNTIPLNI